MPPTLSHALLLTAGLGTRLQPLTFVRAKPAIPVAGIPMVSRIITGLQQHGISEVVLNLHHLPETIAAAVGDGTGLGVRARYSWEHPVVLGSAGGPRQALDIIGADTFLIANGDTLTDAPLGPLFAAHTDADALVTLAVVPNTDPHHYSGLRVASDGAVLGVEPRGSSQPSFHFIGLQVAERRAFEALEHGRPRNSVGDVYAKLIASRPGSIRAHHCNATFQDIGTVADYWRTSRAFASAAGVSAVSANVSLGAGASIIDSIAWDRVEIGHSARLTRCIVTDDVRVEPGACYEDCVLMRGPAGETISVPFATDRA